MLVGLRWLRLLVGSMIFGVVVVLRKLDELIASLLCYVYCSDCIASKRLRADVAVAAF